MLRIRSTYLLVALSLLVSAGCSSSQRVPGGASDSPALTWRGSRNPATDLAMVELSKSHDHYCMEIAAVLGVAESEIRPHTRVIVRQHLRAAGMALGHRIWLHHDLAAGHDLEELRGLYIHELAHTFQKYSFLRNPTWLDEGIADYVRFKLEPDSNWARRAKRGLMIEAISEPLEIHYTDGYFTATALLLHIEEHYDPQFVKTIHRELLDGRYRKSFFQERTGKDLDTLWEELIAKPDAPSARTTWMTTAKTIPSEGTSRPRQEPSAR